MLAQDTLLRNTKKKSTKNRFTSSSASAQNTRQNFKLSFRSALHFTHFFVIALLLPVPRSLFIMSSSSTTPRGVATAFVVPPLPSTLLHHQRHQRPRSSIFAGTSETAKNQVSNVEVVDFELLDTSFKQTTVIPTDQSRNFIPDLIPTKSLRTTLVRIFLRQTLFRSVLSFETFLFLSVCGTPGTKNRIFQLERTLVFLVLLTLLVHWNLESLKSLVIVERFTMN
mmetsp:Transcript_24382/g.34023  ORF Transcript_24382/g.34023 Transcript_24382/m.34023 type:complete len:225 (-) Transcript_24382:3784-4458(-)